MTALWRIVLISILGIIITHSVLSQPLLNEAERARNQQNRLKTVNVYSLKLNKDIDKRTFLDHKLSYDQEGKLLEQTYYDSTDLEMLKWTNIYNSRQQLSERIFCVYRDTIAETVFHYAGNGSLIEEITQNADGVLFSKISYNCDSKGKIISSREEIFPELQPYLHQAYKFDQQGYLLLRFLGESKFHVEHNFKYQYARNGLLEKITEAGHDTVPFGWIIYDYERDGLPKAFTVKHENGKMYKVYYSYDNHQGLKSESRNFYLNTLLLDQEKSEFTNDAKGNIKKQLKYRKNNELSVLYNYTYEYYE
jgi:hypothetical protein